MLHFIFQMDRIQLKHNTTDWLRDKQQKCRNVFTVRKNNKIIKKIEEKQKTKTISFLETSKLFTIPLKLLKVDTIENCVLVYAYYNIKIDFN